MALGHVTYLDLTDEQRREGAAQARDRLKALLANPALLADQRAVLQEQMSRLLQWEAGTVPVKQHVIQAAETVVVKEEQHAAN